MQRQRLETVIDKIDELNAEDPNAYELRYSQQLTDWVLRLEPDASEALRIAARGQHVQRWTIPRSSYPEGRGGYLRWREDLKKFHSVTVANIMKDAGYDEADILRVRDIIMKKNLRSGDADTQALEDALCLLFIETQFDALRAKTPGDKMKEIVRKTWAKMSQRGQQAALALPLSAGNRSLISEALSPEKP